MAVMTRSHVAHIEAGRRVPSKEDARRLDRALNAGDVLSGFLPQDDMAVTDYFESVRLLEQQAVPIREFASAFIPGLLQTKSYTRAVLGSVFPPVSEEECDRHVVTRLERAKLLDDPVTPALRALLDEAVLRRPIGSQDVMAEQITHLVRPAESGRVRVHVLPFGVGFHPLMKGMLTLMTFEDQPPVGYGEAVSMGKIHGTPAVVSQLEARYALALSDAMPNPHGPALPISRAGWTSFIASLV